MASTNIEWASHVWNPIVSGCSHASPGCMNCYAQRMAARLEGMGQEKYVGTTVKSPSGKTVWNGRVKLTEDDPVLMAPLRWKKPRTVFVNSMTDVFHKDVPDRVLDMIFAVMCLCPQHTFQVLTKRAERLPRYMNDPGRLSSVNQQAYFIDSGRVIPNFPPQNVWLGVSCEDQQRADERIPHLLNTNAAVRFVSAEPLLGPINLNSVLGGTQWIGGQRGCRGAHKGYGSLGCPRHEHHHHDERCRDGLSWVIVGGESGHNARPCDVSWIRSIVGDCTTAGVPVFVKQLGSCVFDSARREYTRASTAWPFGTTIDAANRVCLFHTKGGDPNEWPKSLCIRQMPKVRNA